MEEPVQNRGDALFALPMMPRTARLLGALPGWREDLQNRDIELVDGRADVAIGPPSELRDALAAAPVVVIDEARRARRVFRSAGRRPRLLLSLPLRGSPNWIVPLAFPAAARYAVRRFGAGASGIGAVRDAAGIALLSLGQIDRVVPTIAIAGEVEGPPALLEAARDLGVGPASSWALFISPGSAIRRNAFLVFDGRDAQPSLVVKFTRIRDLDVHSDREDRGLAFAAAAGGVVAAVAPTHLGRVEVAGYHAAVQEAAAGTELATLLASRRPEAEKLKGLELVVDWMERSARETASPPEALAPELERLMAHGRRYWREAGLPGDLDERVRAAPAVFRHVELGTDHVFIDGSRMTLLDWEWAQPHGLPVADLTYFGARALRTLDGHLHRDLAEYLAGLMAGRERSSGVMFGWVRRLAGALELAPEMVGPLVTLGLLEHAERGAVERERADAAAGVTHGPSFGERALGIWLRDPALGPDWRAWRG